MPLRGGDARATGRGCEAISPTISASSITERSTWPREAPIVRSSANSLVRCATVIENVLKMMKAPTNTAMPANTSSSVFRKPRLFLTESEASVASCSPVFDLDRVRHHALERDPTSAVGVTPGSAATWIESTLLRLVGEHLRLAAASRPRPSRLRATRRRRTWRVPRSCRSCLPVRPTSEIRSPIFRSSSSAVPLLIATSVGIRGRLALDVVERVESLRWAREEQRRRAAASSPGRRSP